MTENKAVYIVSGQLLDALDADKEATIASLRTDIEMLKAQLNQAKQERSVYAEAGMEAVMIASNALNREAVLLAMLGQRDALIERLDKAINLLKGRE